jgi:hypothetical protein
VLATVINRSDLRLIAQRLEAEARSSATGRAWLKLADVLALMGEDKASRDAKLRALQAFDAASELLLASALAAELGIERATPSVLSTQSPADPNVCFFCRRDAPRWRGSASSICDSCYREAKRHLAIPGAGVYALARCTVCRRATELRLLAGSQGVICVECFTSHT